MNLRAALPRIVFGVVLLIAIIWALLNRETFDAQIIEALLTRLGLWAPLGFMLLWAVCAVLFLPGAIVGLAGGVLFGPFWGALWNLIGATIGATLAFLASRYVASDWVKKRTGGRLKQLLDGVEAEGWRFVAFTRLVPLFPFNLLNYALGLTRINVGTYVLTTFVAMAPGTIAYTYLGYAGREAVTGGEGLIQKGLVALALLAVVAFVPRLVRRVRGHTIEWLEIDALKARLDSGKKLMLVDVRGAEEFDGPSGHIPDSTNWPLDELPDRIEDLRPESDGSIVLICKTDKRSVKAARLLSDAGFEHVPVLRGGVEGWRAKGFEVSVNVSEASMEVAQ